MATKKAKKTTRRKSSGARPPKPKPKAKAKARPADVAAKSRAKPKPKPKTKTRPGTRSSPTGARGAPPRAKAAAVASVVMEALGEVSAPSGRLVLVDAGLAGELARDEIAALSVAVDAIGHGAGISVAGERLTSGAFKDRWRAIHLVVDGSRASVRSQMLGEAPLDGATLLMLDSEALDRWDPSETIDGQADCVFSGRDQKALAREMEAPPHVDGVGWTNLPVAQAERKLLEGEALKHARGWLVSGDVRPHSNHFHLLARARRSKTGAASMEVEGARAFLFFTRWGGGLFPVWRDVDENDETVRVRIELATEEAQAQAERRVTPRS